MVRACMLLSAALGGALDGLLTLLLSESVIISYVDPACTALVTAAVCVHQCALIVMSFQDVAVCTCACMLFLRLGMACNLAMFDEDILHMTVLEKLFHPEFSLAIKSIDVIFPLLGVLIQSLISYSRYVITFFLFLIRAFATGVFQAVYVYTPEVYPTNIRGSALGLCTAAARIGALITPFVAQVWFTAVYRCGHAGQVATPLFNGVAQSAHVHLGAYRMNGHTQVP